jgi:hypothetical protein
LSPWRLPSASTPDWRKAKATSEAAASSIWPRPPTQLKMMGISRAARSALPAERGDIAGEDSSGAGGARK